MEFRPEILVALLLFMLGHLGGAIWFASSIKTQVKGLTDLVKTLGADIKLLGGQDVRIALLDQRMIYFEQRLRETRDLIIGCEARDIERREIEKS